MASTCWLLNTIGLWSTSWSRCWLGRSPKQARSQTNSFLETGSRLCQFAVQARSHCHSAGPPPVGLIHANVAHKGTTSTSCLWHAQMKITTQEAKPQKISTRTAATMSKQQRQDNHYNARITATVTNYQRASCLKKGMTTTSCMKTINEQ